ncbi:ABC transporter substrate-binding protein [Corynebacterium sphenisci]|uniref:ABC transporter substrate-binding protein n=1 Tax=Corynebacterium sphenisci TaxID=191493 RepID=UPI0026E0B685|nr:ABC transporter substrate-binding protein [Corynebacterium sphenisci]MDO5730561.1 ABC transporter substrate-binding protein [Corynebacterium sphenisci]
MRIGKRIAAAGAAIVMACGLGLSGCSAEEGDTADATGADSTVEAEEGAFPVTIEHAFGETTIEKAPKRVVAYGQTDADALFALGVTPVWVTGWTSDGPEEWQKPHIQGEEPVWFMGDVDMEDIAAARPDLIIAMFTSLEQDDYDRMSEIAPTVTYAEGQADYQQDTGDTLLMVGEAVGRPKAAQQLIDELEAKYAGIRERHPNWQGKTAVLAAPEMDDFGVFAPDYPFNRMLARMGFAYPEGLADKSDGELFIGLSGEQADLVDLDFVVWLAGDTPVAEIAEEPVLGNLQVMQEQRSFALAEKLGEVKSNAMNWSTVLSLLYVLDDMEQAIVDTIGE